MAFRFKLETMDGVPAEPPPRSRARCRPGAPGTRSHSGSGRSAYCECVTTTPTNRRCWSSRTWPHKPLAPRFAVRRFVEGREDGKRRGARLAFRPLIRQAREVEHRVQLDRIRRKTGLPVLEVEEGDAHDPSVRTKPELLASLAHLTPPVGGCATHTGRRRRLRDHLIGAGFEDEVEILVWLVPDECHCGVNAPNAALERKPCSRERRWPFVTYQLSHRDCAGSEQAWAVLQRLHLPPLDAAGQRGRIAEVAGVRGRNDSCRQHPDRDDEHDGQNAPAPRQVQGGRGSFGH
jgi:hypothetical protein